MGFVPFLSSNDLEWVFGFFSILHSVTDTQRDTAPNSIGPLLEIPR